MSAKWNYKRLNRIISAVDKLKTIEYERENMAKSEIKNVSNQISELDLLYNKMSELQEIYYVSWFNERERLQKYVSSLNEIADEASEKSLRLRKAADMIVNRRDKICYAMNEARTMEYILEFITRSNSSDRKGTGKFPGIIVRNRIG